MSSLKDQWSLTVTAFFYLLFNLRLSTDLWVTVRSTLNQIAVTAPYVAAATIFFVAILQYMSDRKKVPWDRRLRLFFTIGIIAGFVYAIFEYAGQGVG